MKKLLIALSLILIFTITSFSQTESFQPGWYLVKSGAQVKVVRGNSDDITLNTEWSLISYAENEVLLVFNFNKDIYYCFDPEARVVLVKGKTTLEKISTPGRPVQITEDVKLNLDQMLSNGNNVWLTGFNPSTKTANILLINGQKSEIPQTSLIDLKDLYDLMDKFTDWHTVE